MDKEWKFPSEGEQESVGLRKGERSIEAKLGESRESYINIRLKEIVGGDKRNVTQCHETLQYSIS